MFLRNALFCRGRVPDNLLFPRNLSEEKEKQASVLLKLMHGNTKLMIEKNDMELCCTKVEVNSN